MQGMGVAGNNTRYDIATYIGCGSYLWGVAEIHDFYNYYNIIWLL